MDNVYRSHSGYFNRAFDNLEDIANEMRVTVKGVKFDTMVGTGLSGTLVVPTLARIFGTHWAIVRKEHSPHTNSTIEGEIGHRWLFVDDFICSGTTLQRVQTELSGLKQYNYELRESVPYPTEYAGAYLYEGNRYVSP